MNIRKVLVVGSGTLGQQIGFQCAMHGFDTVMYDLREESLDSCRASHRQYAELFKNQKGRSQAEVDAALARLSYTTDLAAAGSRRRHRERVGAREPRRQAEGVSAAEPACPAKTIFTTNTSTLLPSQFADATGRPERFLALHFANEIWDRNVGEVMGHPGTDPAIYEIVVQFAKAIGMVPIRLDVEQNGYVLNSILVPWLMAAQTLVTNGIARPEDIDRTWMITHQDAGGTRGYPGHGRPRDLPQYRVVLGRRQQRRATEEERGLSQDSTSSNRTSWA